ncbi:MAG: adenylate/guanylate cyclase domain-containing protein [Gammaproteobacteria bacterium]|nr:adenylate/guanylate cyclase domain-containing protein [Gammaproteobacteria bacterium]
MATPRAHRGLDCAVMFVDMRGFTRASGQLGPDEVVALLEGYFALVVERTLANGGRPCNMTGDGVVSAFGLDAAEGSGEGPGPRALRAAREVLDAWKASAADWQARHGVITGIGIGIHLGPVIAGPIGPASFRHDTVVGDTVNIAARLCQRARAGEALFSDAVRAAPGIDALGLEMLELPPLQIRGRDTPLGMHCLPAPERLDLGAD